MEHFDSDFDSGSGSNGNYYTRLCQPRSPVDCAPSCYLRYLKSLVPKHASDMCDFDDNLMVKCRGGHPNWLHLWSQESRTPQLEDVEISDQSLVNLIGNHPKVCNFSPDGYSLKVGGVKENMVEASLECKDIKLEKLKTVEIDTLEGHKTELLLVKLLLGGCTSLESMSIILSAENDIDERIRVSGHVNKFRRASLKTKVMIIDPEDN